MQLMRIGQAGSERPAVRLDDRHYIDVGDYVDDFDADFFENRLAGLARFVEERKAVHAIASFEGARVGAPISRPHQIICIGLNYRDHAMETGQSIPSEPIVFTKAPNSMVGPFDDVRIPEGSTKTDWEVELGVVIGRRTSYLRSPDDAEASIAGYVISNDVSERAFQNERGGQWSKGKSAETFNPCGPWLATRDEVENSRSLDMWLDVNGVRQQAGSTSTMIFDPNFLVYYLSQFMVLEPGDLINTGTPPGVGMGKVPPMYLRPGDEIRLGIDGLGYQKQSVVAPRSALKEVVE